MFVKSLNKIRESEALSALLTFLIWSIFCVLLILLVACRLDIELHTTYIRDAVCIAFIANETISIIENAGLMGVPIPAPIIRALELLKQKEEDNGS